MIIDIDQRHQVDMILLKFVFAMLILVVAGYTNEPDTSRINKTLLDKYDGYGVDWIFMPDGRGQPQVAVLRGQLPESRANFDEDLITFILYTRSGTANGTSIALNDTEVLMQSGFSSARQTKIITHGWKSSIYSEGFQTMKDAYLAYDDLNVFLLNWEPLAASTFYLGPVSNTIKVGTYAAQFIDFLAASAGLRTKDVHFIGHSLGAHVAGNAGSRVTSGSIGRCTGLDPAYPGVHIFLNVQTRLDPTDADFVDIIHTCGGVLGWMQPLGDVDFYPNAGTAVQPGCCCVPELLDACSHGRSYRYFTESINSKVGFRARKCSNWDYFINGNCTDGEMALMGAHTKPTSRGTHYLRTRPNPPHAYVDTDDITSNEI